MSVIENGSELSGTEEEQMLMQALETLAWSEHAWCVTRQGPLTGAWVCYAHSIECEHDMWAADGFDLPEMLDGIDALGWDEASRKKLDEELREFTDVNRADLATSGLDIGQIAHDFILTRNHHGAGFWDRGLGDVGRRLTDAAQAYGSVSTALISAWRDDDGTIHGKAVIE